MSTTTIAPEWTPLVEAWVAWMRAGGAAEGTAQLRRHHVERFARETGIPPGQVTTEDLVEWLAGKPWQLETLRAYRAGLRAFYKHAVATGTLERNPAVDLPKVRIPAGVPRPAPDEVVERGLAAADPRVRLMVQLATLAGMRRGEIAAARWSWLLDGQLRIVGKGRRVRLVPLHPTLEYELALEWRRRIFAGEQDDGYLFPGRIDGHLSPAYVGVMIRRALGDGWSAHPLRHRFASRAYAAQRDLRAVQELLGHSRLETTQRYVAVPDGALYAAVLAAGMHPPGEAAAS